MIYFSELKGKGVYTEDNIKIGKLEDLIFKASDRPTISKIIVQDPGGISLKIPINYVTKINKSIFIRKDYQTSEFNENELFLVKNVLDKQIIDLQDNKVVRVNDITIQDNEGLYISGVDIGLLGILRWFKVESLFHKLSLLFNFKINSSMLSWADIQPLELTRGQVKLKKEEGKMEKLRPEDLADYLERTNIKNVNKMLKILDEKFAAEVIGSLNINFQTSLFKQFSPEKAAKVLELIEPDDAVDILLTIAKKKRDEIISFIDENKRKKINHLLEHSHSPIGEVMRSDFMIVKPDDTVKVVIDKIKQETSDYFYFNIVYVVNKNNELIGLFNLHSLLLQDLNTPIYKFMVQNVIIVHMTTPKEIATKKILKYKLYSLPVIDERKKILGIVTLGDLLE